MDKNKFLWWAQLFGLLVFTLVLAGCGNSGSTDSVSSVAKVSTVTVTDQIETTGNLGADQLVTLKWGTSGLVDKVNVKMGQKVKSGEILAVLNADSVPAAIIQAQSDLAAAQRDLQDMLDTNLVLAQAQLAVIEARKNVEEAQNVYDALAYPRASDTLIKNTEAKITDAEHAVVLATKKYKEYNDHPDGDPQKTAALLAMTNAQLNLNDLKATLNWYIAKPSAADYEEAKINLEIARANLDAARQKRDRVKTGADPLDIAAAQAKIAASQAKVDAMAIIAPFDGEVIFIQALPNNAVKESDAAIGLVNRDTMKIDTLIDETSISGVSIGDEAQISMDSLPDVVLKGKVALINPVGSTVNGLVKYTVAIAVDPTDQPVLFGATASIVLLTSEPHSMLAVPIGAVQTSSQGEYVMRVGENGNNQRVTVVSGDLSGNLVTITTTGDLKEGDQVLVVSSSSSSGGSNNNRNNQGPGGGPFGIGGG